jgi:hypothetical protein
MNNRISPFLKKDLPNMELDVTKAEMTEEEAYRLCYPMGLAKWQNYGTADGSVLHYYSYILNHVGYFAVCGARGCIRACMDNLEKNKRIENTFHNQFYRKKSWILPNDKDKKQGRINPWREEWLDKKYPNVRKGEY